MNEHYMEKKIIITFILLTIPHRFSFVFYRIRLDIFQLLLHILETVGIYAFLLHFLFFFSSQQIHGKIGYENNLQNFTLHLSW
jgi:hypothetical protein